MWRCLEIAEEMNEKVIRIGRPSIFCYRTGLKRLPFVLASAIIEYYDFVDAEDGKGAGNLPSHRGAKFMGLSTGNSQSVAA